MVSLLPVLAIGSPKRFWRIPLPCGAKLRAWVALIGAAFVGQFASFHLGASMPVEVAWAIIDGCAAMAVLWPPKSGVYRSEGQRAIGLIFAAMMLVSLGFHIAGLMQPGPRDFTGITQFQTLLGWLQWACLLSWGVGDALERAFRRALPVGYPVSDRIGGVR